jgi:hypothetical protein
MEMWYGVKSLNTALLGLSNATKFPVYISFSGTSGVNKMDCLSCSVGRQASV